jgi:hypothetical protein
VVETLRHGWYGNRLFFKEHEQEIDPIYGCITYNGRYVLPCDMVDCYSLVQHTITDINTKYIPMCEGISGSLGSLVIDPSYETNLDGLPIDMVVLNVANTIGNKVGVEEETANNNQQQIVLSDIDEEDDETDESVDDLQSL